MTGYKLILREVKWSKPLKSEPAKPRPAYPTLPDLIRHGVRAAAAWAAAGFPLATDDQLAIRRVTCDACDHWTGRTCQICGCTRLKLWLATERCPAGKWPA